MVRVFINVESAKRRSGGIGKYIHHLIKALSKSDVVENLYGFSGVSWQEYSCGQEGGVSLSDGTTKTSFVKNVARYIPGLKTLHQKVVDRIFWIGANKRLKQGLGEEEKSIYHEPNYILKPFDGYKVATIHDLSFIYYPHFHPAARVEYLKKNLPNTLSNADHLITDTECIRNELIDEFNVRPEKVTAIHLGVDKSYQPRPRDIAVSVLDKYSLQYGGYFLSVATLEPRKNLMNVLEAFKQLPGAYRQKYPLVLVGCDGWMNSNLHREIKNLQQNGEATILCYVDEKDLPYLYSGARSVVFIPIYEGFGLPALEAMASGVPLLTSDIPCLKEVVADGGLYVPVNDISVISFGMTEVLTNDVVRENLIDSGLERASQFSWKKCGLETLSVYKKLLEKK